MARNTAAEEADTERSLGTIIKDLTADLSMLFRSEIALLKLEIKDTVAKLGGGIGMFAAAVFLALLDRKSTRLNSSHLVISYAVFCLKKKKQKIIILHKLN